MRKITAIPFCMGCIVATAMIVFYYLIYFDKIHIMELSDKILSSICPVLCPCSILLMGVDLSSGLDIYILISYATVIFLNGATYVFIVYLIRKIGRLLMRY